MVLKDLREGNLGTLEPHLNTLSFREREIIKLRYGIGTGYTYTLNEIGYLLKLPRQRVREIKNDGIRKLTNRRKIDLAKVR